MTVFIVVIEQSSLSSAQSNPEISVKQLSSDIASCMSKDKFRLLSRLRKFRNLTADKKPEYLVKLQHDVNKSAQIYTTRQAQRPEIDFPSLPVCERKDEIAEAITNNQVVIIAGETGSGKTTQIHKICLDLGRGIGGAWDSITDIPTHTHNYRWMGGGRWGRGVGQRHGYGYGSEPNVPT